MKRTAAITSLIILIVILGVFACAGPGGGVGGGGDHDPVDPVTPPAAPSDVLLLVWGDSTNNTCNHYFSCYFMPAISWVDNSDNEDYFRIQLLVQSQNYPADTWNYTAPANTVYFEVPSQRFVEGGQVAAKVWAVNSAGESETGQFWLDTVTFCFTCDDYYQ